MPVLRQILGVVALLWTGGAIRGIGKSKLPAEAAEEGLDQGLSEETLRRFSLSPKGEFTQHAIRLPSADDAVRALVNTSWLLGYTPGDYRVPTLWRFSFDQEGEHLNCRVQTRIYGITGWNPYKATPFDIRLARFDGADGQEHTMIYGLADAAATVFADMAVGDMMFVFSPTVDGRKMRGKFEWFSAEDERLSGSLFHTKREK